MTSSEGRPVALVTGASSGIGEATVRALAAAGYETVSAARRLERCQALAEEVGGRAIRLDVTDAESIAVLASELDRVDVVVHSAGGALGLDPIAEARDEDWIGMFESNVLGVMRLTRDLLGKLEAGEGGHIIVIGSIAGFEVYPGGGGYTAAKHGANAIVRTLRLELLGKPIRVTEVAPGAVETEFSLVRFEGDEERAAKVYEGLEPLVAGDVAELVAFAVTRPKHVNIDSLVVRPVAQATARDFHRGS